MKKGLKGFVRYLGTGAIVLWSMSVAAIVVSFFACGGSGYLELIASVIGVTSLIFNAKGNPVGQVLCIAFSVLYGVISYACAYYGEMNTYLGMTAPMAIISLISWIKNPYDGNRSEVKVNRLGKKEICFMIALTALVTVAFYFILSYFNTANLLPSTISVTTSFLAVYLTFRRSVYYAIAYAANDVVLIVLWTLATLTDASYLSVIVCFAVFLLNDVYGFISWRKMRSRQENK